MSRVIRLENVNATFDLAARIKGERITFQIQLVGDDTVRLKELFAATVDHVTLAIRGNTLIMSFDHSSCDGLGAIRKIHQAISGKQVPSIEFVDRQRAPCIKKTVSRRTMTRMLGRIQTPRARLGVDGFQDLRSLLFVVEAVAVGDGTLTERTVQAIHKLLLIQADSPREYTSVLVPVTVWPWDAFRPAANLSSGFISVATMHDLRSGKLDRKVKEHFKAGRDSRIELLRRASNFGRLPRNLWGPVGFLARRYARLGESAVVSNLGTIRDTALQSLGCYWFFIPSVRTTASIAVGLVRLGDILTVTVSGYATSASLREVSTEIFDLTGITAKELCSGHEDC